MKWIATGIAGLIGAFLLLGLVLNLAEGTRSGGPVVGMYIGVVLLVLAAGYRIDKRRARRRRA